MILTDFFFYFDQTMLEMMPILPIYFSTFGQMGMGIDGVAPKYHTLQIEKISSYSMNITP